MRCNRLWKLSLGEMKEDASAGILKLGLDKALANALQESILYWQEHELIDFMGLRTGLKKRHSRITVLSPIH